MAESPRPSAAARRGSGSGEASSVEEVLADELVEEILVRLPIDDPSCLARAGPGFRRRFGELHRRPPLLGHLLDTDGDDESCLSQFVPTDPFRAPAVDLDFWRAIDSRHGRVLLNRVPERFGPFQDDLRVWNPVTDMVLELPKLPRCPNMQSWSAAVLCAGGACDHVVCHRARGPFRVVFAGTDKLGIFFCVYSSATSAWSERAYFVDPHGHDELESMPPPLLGNALYFHFQISASILRYDLGGRGMSIVRRPPACSSFHGRVVLVNMENGGSLGFAYLYDSTLYLWSREMVQSSSHG
ncbi:hypothetical protein BAE44_0018377 [Dichanthelium oligosanthes]|uniref:F-box domain-containing protein n=1 Tax=Dichanthelium oligosanthes TaxID=888268 RepID=A0A1E5V6D7_9POAL|nr:hypothetical protein BAE44_0018377 [Dichanthelium oligosanthes]